MKPHVPAVLKGVIGNITAQLNPMPPGPEAMGLWGLRVVLSVLERDWNDAVSQRVDEIEGLAALIRRGAEHTGAAQRDRLLAAVGQAGSATPDLRVPALDAELDRLRAALIELQAQLEAETEAETETEAVATAQARVWLRDSWQLLADASRRRALHDSPW